MTKVAIRYSLLPRRDTTHRNNPMARPTGQWGVYSMPVYSDEFLTISTEVVPEHDVAARIAQGYHFSPTVPRRVYNLVVGRKTLVPT